MTPQEELFAKFYNEEKVLIKDLSTLELRAKREELAKIAHEARARLTAIDDADRERRAKNRKESGPTGFATSLQVDPNVSNAINKAKKRVKMDKADKLKQQLMNAGIDEKTAEQIVSAGHILKKTQQDKPDNKEVIKNKDLMPFKNPFAKKDEPNVDVHIIEETNTVVIHEKEEKKPSFLDLFKKLD